MLILGIFGLQHYADAVADSPVVQELFSKAKAGNTASLVALRQKANQGDASAQRNLGFIYDNGQGVTQNYGKAVAWYRKAADKGDAIAQYSLAVMYSNGDGVTQDDAKAAAWYRKAADQGYTGAQFNLGAIYEEGRGVTKNYAQAVAWYHKAADLGYASAQNNLGLMYANGQGVTQNYVLAYQWFALAKSASNLSSEVYERSSYNLEAFAQKITPAQISQAQKAVADWVRLHPTPQ